MHPNTHTPLTLLPPLHSTKTLINQQEQDAKQNINSFFQALTNCLQTTHKEILNTLEQQILNFHEGISATIKAITKVKGNLLPDQTENALQMIKCKVMYGSKVDQQKLIQLLSQIYYVQIGVLPNDNSKIQLPSLAESDMNASLRMYDQATVQKIQSERDYYQRRQQQLQKKLRQFQVSRKGSNIRELSKSALQEKCSRWAIERLRQQKRVLIEKIGEASQQLMKQETVMSQQQQEIRKLGAMVGEINGGSIVVNSTMRNLSIMGENEGNHEKQRQLQSKNAELMVELTAYMQRYQQVYENNQQLQKELQYLVEKYKVQEGELAHLRRECSMINHDYENNLRKKAAVQQEYTQMKQSYEELTKKSQEQRQTLKNLVEGLQLQEKQIKQTLRRMQADKKAEILALQQKIAYLTQQREKLLKKFQEISNKTGEETNYKQLLNDQIARLLKQNTSLEKELHAKQEVIFETKQTLSKVQGENKEIIKKVDLTKKQQTQMKKIHKQLQKQNSQLKIKLNSAQNFQFKITQLQQYFSNLQNEFIKCKQATQRKSNIQQKVMSTMKERFNLHLAQLLEEDGKKIKKEKMNKNQLIQKFIEQMAAFSSKTAQIKQLKEQLRELRDKEGKDSRKKQKTNLDESVISLEHQMWATSNKIFEERLNNEKLVSQERLNQMSQILKKEELIKKALGEELQKERSALSEWKVKQKNEKIVEQTSKTSKHIQQKIERLQQQIKKLKLRNKKLQSDANDSQSELKTKKELILGLRNQLKIKEDSIIQLYKEIDSLKGEIDKLQRNTRQMGNKQELLRQFKESYRKIQQQKEELIQSLEEFTQKNKQLLRQIGKKDEVIKELSAIQDKENKKKEEVIVKSLNHQIVQLRETVRKLRIDNDRKEEINKNTKVKTQAKIKEIQEGSIKYERLFKEKEGIDRKLDALNSNLKKHQQKQGQLSWIIKKIFQLCCLSTAKTQKSLSKAKPQTTQYYTNSSISPHTLKLGTPASNLKSFISCQGLQILNLRPQDIQECLGVQTSSIIKTDYGNGQSWSMGSPIINKRRQHQRKEVLMQGLQDLQRLLGSNELSGNLVVDLFKQILQK